MVKTWKKINKLSANFFSFHKSWIFITLLLASSILTDNTSFAQIFPKAPPLLQSMTKSRPLSPMVSNTQTRTIHDLHSVKITSPANGQEVAVGKDLVISGSSADNTTTPDCQVSVVANGIKPYHNALPSGSGGRENNYSKWSFNLTPAYTTIKQGENKITAKFSCPSDPSLLDHTSVNITGVVRVPNAVKNTNSIETNVPSTTIDIPKISNKP
ncbi:MAG: Ig-like domain-containing protein [Thermoproteota archaeon]|nr:Ig-like domain-containing protein [Thermoproteota archaeon]